MDDDRSQPQECMALMITNIALRHWRIIFINVPLIMTG